MLLYFIYNFLSQFKNDIVYIKFKNNTEQITSKNYLIKLILIFGSKTNN